MTAAAHPTPRKWLIASIALTILINTIGATLTYTYFAFVESGLNATNSGKPSGNFPRALCRCDDNTDGRYSSFAFEASPSNLSSLLAQIGRDARRCTRNSESEIDERTTDGSGNQSLRMVRSSDFLCLCERFLSFYDRGWMARGSADICRKHDGGAPLQWFLSISCWSGCSGKRFRKYFQQAWLTQSLAVLG